MSVEIHMWGDVKHVACGKPYDGEMMSTAIYADADAFLDDPDEMICAECIRLARLQAGRYEVRNGKFGAYHYDRLKKRDMTLKQVTKRLNSLTREATKCDT